MNIEQTLEIKHSILVDERLLRDLVEYLKTKYETIEIKAECSDGSTRNTKELNDFMRFDNADHQRILKLTISGRSSYKRSIYIRLQQGSLFYSNSVSIESEEEEQLVTVREWVLSKIRGSKFHWLHDLISRISFGIFAPVLIGSIFSAYLFLLFYAVKGSNSSYTSGLLTSISLVMIIFACSSSLQKWFFPRVFFSINKGERSLHRIYEHRKHIFEFIFIVVVAGLIIELLGNYVWSSLTRAPK